LISLLFSLVGFLIVKLIVTVKCSRPCSLGPGCFDKILFKQAPVIGGIPVAYFLDNSF
jgi:hypothetical protein